MRFPFKTTMLTGVIFAPLSVQSNPVAPTIDKGEKIYKQLCFTCHGPDLKGGIGPALTDGYWQHGSSPTAILDVINNGVTGTEMIGYKDVFPEENRVALRDFLLAKQVGFRQLVRSYYDADAFKKKRLTPALFDSVESTVQKEINENVLWVDRQHSGGVRMQAKLYIQKGGEHEFRLKSYGKTAILLNGKEVFYSDEKGDKKENYSKKTVLKPGVHDVEILHISRARHGWRLSGSLTNLSGGSYQIHGRSLQGSAPKEIRAGASAKVVRKWIRSLPPRALMCLLPNKVIVAFDPVNGKINQAWHGAHVNQTPSLPDRSANPSEVKGKEISGAKKQSIKAKTFQFVSYETQGDKVLISAMIDGKLRTITIAPDGDASFKISTK